MPRVLSKDNLLLNPIFLQFHQFYWQEKSTFTVEDIVPSTVFSSNPSTSCPEYSHLSWSLPHPKVQRQSNSLPVLVVTFIGFTNIKGFSQQFHDTPFPFSSWNNFSPKSFLINCDRIPPCLSLGAETRNGWEWIENMSVCITPNFHSIIVNLGRKQNHIKRFLIAIRRILTLCCCFTDSIHHPLSLTSSPKCTAYQKYARI